MVHVPYSYARLPDGISINIPVFSHYHAYKTILNIINKHIKYPLLFVVFATCVWVEKERTLEQELEHAAIPCSWLVITKHHSWSSPNLVK